MKKMSKQRERVYTVIFMAVITAVFISALTGLHLLTAETIRLNEKLAQRRAVLYTAGLPADGDGRTVASNYAAYIEEVRTNKKTAPVYYRYFTNREAVSDSRKAAGFIFRSSGSGLWGEIIALVGMKRSLDQLSGLNFLKQSETPGLGARIEERWFREQFRGKRGPDFVPVAEKSGAQGAGKFDGITGASVTTAAVEKILERTWSSASNRLLPADRPGRGD